MSLAEFVFAAWPTLEPATPLDWNWHLDAICAHVEAVLRGPGALGDCPLTGRPWAWAQNLVINVPPGTMKSLIASVCAPAWMWLWRPSWRSIFASANPRVSVRDSMRCRDLIRSDWYRDTFSPRWKLKDDQDAKTLYGNDEGGFRLALSTGAKVVGDRVDHIGIDDPLDPAEAPSKPARDSVILWWDQAVYNRVASPERSTRILIQQRVHVDDLAGHVLAAGGWAHLCLPMEFE